MNGIDFNRIAQQRTSELRQIINDGAYNRLIRGTLQEAERIP